MDTKGKGPNEKIAKLIEEPTLDYYMEPRQDIIVHDEF